MVGGLKKWEGVRGRRAQFKPSVDVSVVVDGCEQERSGLGWCGWIAWLVGWLLFNKREGGAEAMQIWKRGWDHEGFAVGVSGWLRLVGW